MDADRDHRVSALDKPQQVRSAIDVLISSTRTRTNTKDRKTLQQHISVSFSLFHNTKKVSPSGNGHNRWRINPRARELQKKAIQPTYRSYESGTTGETPSEAPSSQHRAVGWSSRRGKSDRIIYISLFTS